MYQNIIDLLMKKENLNDVAYLGHSAQSSLSKWSEKNDAQRAVNGDNRDCNFAFHTDKEKDPWWELEFDAPVKLSYIIINNRKHKEFQWISSSLKVITTNEVGEEITIHKGRVFFGSLPKSLPLILPLNDNLFVKKIKIQLEGFNYLHLSDIHCLSKKSLQQIRNKPIYFANRRDGLGERLRALLNAMDVAKKENGYFCFSWETKINEFHAADNVDKVFTKEFINNHYMSFQQISSLNTIDLNESKSINQKYLNFYDGITVNQGTGAYRELFNSIEFSDEINLAIQAALDTSIPEKIVGIHLRSGDIVYANFRFNNLFYHKVIPIYVLDQLIEKLHQQDQEVIVFGQDSDFCRFLCQKHEITFAGDLVDKNFNTAQAAIFDIVLMSRCHSIFAKSSGFATLSSSIGNNVKIQSYEDVFINAELIDVFNKSMLKNGLLNNDSIYVSPLLKSFSISHFIDSHQEVLSIERKIELIDRCIILDSPNFYYKMLKSIFLYQSNQMDEADNVLLDALESQTDSHDLTWLAKFKSWSGTTILLNYIETFKEATIKGSVVSAIPLLLHEHHYTKSVDFSFYERLTSNSDLKGTEMLKQKIRELNN